MKYQAGWHNEKAALIAELREHKGNYEAVARATGTPVSTLKTAANRHGIVLFPVEKEVLIDPAPELRLENRRLRAAAEQALKGDVATARVLQVIQETASALAPDWSTYEIPAPTPGDRTEQEMMLLWSDLHAAEVVSSEETRGINEYNWSIMEERMEKTVRAVASHADHFGFNVSRLHVAMLGDMLSGDIHEELKVTNDRPLSEAIVDLAAAHVPFLLSLAERFPKIKVSGVPGNHPRYSKKPQAKQAHNNADWLFYQFLAALLRDHPQFEFDIVKGSYNVLTIADRWRMLLMHGDGIRTTMPGVPWGGVIRRVTVLESQFVAAKQPLDYIALGHFHTQNALDGVATKTFVNGSVKGADEYSLKQFGSGRPAAQTLLSFHPKRGWTGSYAVELQPRQPGSEGWS
jgi:hypothetical protein